MQIFFGLGTVYGIFSNLLVTLSGSSVKKFKLIIFKAFLVWIIFVNIKSYVMFVSVVHKYEVYWCNDIDHTGIKTIAI